MGYTYEAGKAVDGLYLPGDADEGQSLIHTWHTANPWWRVDLEETHCITSVNILNRAGECFEVYITVKTKIPAITIIFKHY